MLDLVAPWLPNLAFKYRVVANLGFVRTGVKGGNLWTPLVFPRAVLIWGISLAIGFKILNWFASGLLRAHGRES